MSGKIPDVGLDELLDKLLGAYGNTLVMHLYKNDYTPVAGSTLGSFTEADFNGYASQTITTWSAASTSASVCSSTATALTWTKSAGGTTNNVYGYYVEDADGELLWAERDPSAPGRLSATGDTYTVTPEFQLVSEF